MRRFTTAAFAGIIVSLFSSALHGESIPFESNVTWTQQEITPTGFTFLFEYAEGPFTWFASSGASTLPGFDDSMTGVMDMLFTGAPAIDPVEMLVKVPFAGTWTMATHAGDGSVTGTMVMTGAGEMALDIDPATIIVNEDAGMILQQVGSPLLGDLPFATGVLTEATGVLEAELVGDWQMYASGYSAIPLIPGMPLMDNLSVPPMTMFGQAVTVGAYVPEPSTFVLLSMGALTLTVGWWRRRRAA